MMTINRFNILIVFLFISLVSFSQSSDFGMWTEVNASKKIHNKLKGDISFAVRTYNNSTKVEQIFGEAGLQYKINDVLSIASSYRLTSALENDLKYYFLHKLFFDFKSSISSGDFNFSSRLRLQFANRTYLSDASDNPYRYYTRFKLKSQYNIPSCKVNPFLSFESFIPVARGNGFEIGKYRISAGAEVKVAKKTTLEAGYIFEHDKRPDLVNSHIIAVGLNLTF